MHSSKELSIFYNFLNELWPTEIFLFYLKCRKAIVQIKLGDNYKGELELQQVKLSQSEVVSVAVKMFNGLASATSIVQKLTARLLDSDFTDVVPGNVLLVNLIEIYYERMSQKVCVGKGIGNGRGNVGVNGVNGANGASGASGACGAHGNNAANGNNGTNGAKNSVDKPKLPPRKESNGFDIMKYGKHVSGPKKISTQENSFYIDEELHSATVEASPPSNEKPVFYRISNTFDNFSEELSFCRDELEKTVIEKDKLKEALEETVEFCDSLSYEHDLLLIQNSKLKKLLSIVTDKLIRIDQDAINDIDFTDVLDDPCVDFKPTGILKEKKNAKTEKGRQHYLDLPFSENAGKDMGKKKVPATPKFSASQNEFEEDVLVCCEDYLPSQAGLLNMSKGDKIKKISELDDWFFGENLENGTRGFFPPASIRTNKN